MFGSELPRAVAYASLLAGPGIERGLIGPRERERLWERHLINSASVESLVPQGSEVLDIGSGAGLPGVPLALVRPDLQVTLVEPLLRRAVFLTEVCAELSLPNVSVVRSRAEQLPDACADVVVARAVAPLPRLAEWTLRLLRAGGLLVALKGRASEQEVEQAEPVLRRLGARAWRVHLLETPAGVEATRAVVVVAGKPPPRR